MVDYASKIGELKTARQQTLDAYLEQKKLLNEQFGNIINDYVEPYGATVIRLTINRDSSGKKPIVYAEIGFKKNSGYDFGSSFDFYFENDVVSVNAGTIGRYDKTNVCQLRRAAVLNAIWTNIEVIEDGLKSIDVSSYLAAEKADDDLQWEIIKIEDEKKNYEIDHIIKNKIKAGVVLEHSEDTRAFNRLWRGTVACVIEKVTAKKVYLKAQEETWWNIPRTIDIRYLAAKIQSGVIVC